MAAGARRDLRGGEGFGRADERRADPRAPLIEVKHICTRFGAAVVHEDVSLAIDKGEVFAIAGGNGSGRRGPGCNPRSRHLLLELEDDPLGEALVRGNDLFRIKGIVAINGDPRRHVLQGVHRLQELRAAEPWGAARPWRRRT